MRWGVGLLVLGPQVVVLAAAAHLYAALNNTLERNGAWVASKTLLEKRVIGAFAFFTSRQTLAGEQLDLGRWLGFQEVVHREPLALRGISVRFRAEEDAYLDVLYHKDETGFCGLRVGARVDPPFAYRADAGRRFQTRTPVELARPAPGEWHRLELRFETGAVHAALDDGPAVRIPGRDLERQLVGFRSGLRTTVIDDVRLLTSDGREISESFSNRRDRLIAFSLGLVLMLIVNGAAHARLRRVRWTRRHVQVAGSLGLALVLGSVVVFATYQTQFARSYRKRDPGAEKAWRTEEADAVDSQLRARYPGPAPQGVVRVLVIGSSQTWGAGARRTKETFVAALERALRAHDDERRTYECLNGGVSGLQASWLLQLYRERWLALEPDLLVVNLSNNDGRAESFARALEGFIHTNAKHGVRTVFALEANSPEAHPGPLPMHATMRRVAEEHGVRLVDVHAFLRQRAGKGILWWDLVHPTSLGHGLIAEALAPHVLAEAELVEGRR